MSITAFYVPGTSTLAILGDATNNVISVGRNSAGDLLINNGTVQINGTRASASNTRFISIFGFGGNDTLKIDETNGKMPQAVLVGGEGNDTLIGGSGIDFLFGDSGNDIVDGNGGNDQAWLGAGDDTFIWDPGDGSDRVEGGAGLDRMIFNGSNGNEVFDLSANGSRLKLFRDLGNIVMDTASVEAVDINALGGTDKITVNNLAATEVRSVNLSLESLFNNGIGDTQADQVILNGTDNADTIAVVAGSSLAYQVTGLPSLINVKGSEAIDRLTINGLGGDDKLSATALPAVLTQLTLDGGAGNDSFIGGRGNDTFFGGDGNDFVNGGAGDDIAFLGAGDDVFVWNPGDGSDIVEGQAGHDILRFVGANVSEQMTVSANGSRAKLFRDVANITMDFNETEQLDIIALGGQDVITINDMSGTGVKQINLDLAGNTPLSGDGLVDRIVINGTNADDTIVVNNNATAIQVFGLAANISIVNADRNDILELKALGGDDVLEASALAADRISLRLSGDAGDDVLIGSSGDDSLDGGAGDDVLLGGPGTDVLTNGEVNVQ